MRYQTFDKIINQCLPPNGLRHNYIFPLRNSTEITVNIFRPEVITTFSTYDIYEKAFVYMLQCYCNVIYNLLQFCRYKTSCKTENL